MEKEYRWLFKKVNALNPCRECQSGLVVYFMHHTSALDQL
jgi:hypothetical protein